MQKVKQMSESIRLGALLALSGGLMDAYSYLERDHVFANAQTGNILLFGVNLSQGNFSSALRYFLPVLAFELGVMLAELVHARKSRLLHWRQWAVLAEALILTIVAFLPQSVNLLANSLTSFACGIQVDSFRTIRGNRIATTMCIGNMRGATHNLCGFLHSGSRDAMQKSLLYYGIILCFVIGAVIGSYAMSLLHERAILCSTVLLLAAFAFMFVDYEHTEQNDAP